MKIMSLIKLAEESGYIAEEQMHLLGAIQNPRTFEENFATLDEMHKGCYAFLAFHPDADKQVVDYINEGSLGDDAGPNILVPINPHQYADSPAY